MTYDLPSPGAGKALRAAFGGCSADVFVLARTAPPVDLDSATAPGLPFMLMPRPDIIPRQPLELFGSGYPGGKIYNKQAFIAAPAGEQGDLGRNVLRGFDAAQADLGVQRIFRLREKVGLRVRGEFFNLLNFGSPTALLTSALFGRSTQTLANALGTGGNNGGFNPLYQIGGPRSAQLALKLLF